MEELHSQLPEISDNIGTFDDLVNVIKDLIKNHLNVEKDTSISFENTEEISIANFLKEVGMQPTASQEDAIKQIRMPLLR